MLSKCKLLFYIIYHLQVLSNWRDNFLAEKEGNKNLAQEMCQWINISVHNMYILYITGITFSYFHLRLLQHMDTSASSNTLDGRKLVSSHKEKISSLQLVLLYLLMFDVSADAYKTPKFRFCNNSYNTYVHARVHCSFFRTAKLNTNKMRRILNLQKVY